MSSALLLLALAAPPGPLSGVLTAIERTRQKEARPVVVFDLDATLFDNGPRTKHILLEVAHRDPELRPMAGRIARLPETGLPYRVDAILGRAEIIEPDVVKRLVDGWRQRFFTDAYQAFDRPLPGAVAFVEAAHARGATVVYLTGRDAPGMGAGAVESLRRFGFPVLTPTAILIMKPRFRTPDEDFKAEAVATVEGLGTVVAAFENEPKNANLFARTWPKAQVFFLTTQSDPDKRVPLLDRLVKISDYTSLGGD